jgi:predicted MFS family arabinose efflux permease
MKHRSAASARTAVSALFVGNGFAFGVWSAHISVFKQNYGLSNQQLTIPLGTLALGAILSMPVAGRVFHRVDSSGIAWKGQLCYAVALAFLPWTKSLAELAIGTFCFGALRGLVDVSNNTQAIITERAYGSAVMSSLQGFWSLGGLIGAGFSSLLLRQHTSAKQDLAAAGAAMIVIVLSSRSYLLPENSPVNFPARWSLSRVACGHWRR